MPRMAKIRLRDLPRQVKRNVFRETMGYFLGPLLYIWQGWWLVIAYCIVGNLIGYFIARLALQRILDAEAIFTKKRTIATFDRAVLEEARARVAKRRAEQ